MKKRISVRRVLWNGAMTALCCCQAWHFARKIPEAFFGMLVAMILTMLMLCLALAIAHCSKTRQNGSEIG